MKSTHSTKSLLIALLLLWAGLVSPSNGVEDLIQKTPTAILHTFLSILFIVASICFVYLLVKQLVKIEK